jgi:hypothetical protein
VAAVVCGRFCRAAWAADGRVARRRSSIASGGTSGWRSRKVVLVVCAGRGGAAGCRGGGPESLAVLWASISCRVGDKVALAQFSWRFGFFTFLERPLPAPPIAVMAFSLRHGWEARWSRRVRRPLYHRCVGPLCASGWLGLAQVVSVLARFSVN